MRRCGSRTFAAAALALVLGALLPGDVAARLSIIPGRPGRPRPTSSQIAPTPRPTATAAGSPSVRACQRQIAGESAVMIDAVRGALGTCLTRGTRCLVEQSGSTACCEEAALECQSELNAIAAATRRFRETVRGGACGALPLDRLLASDDLGFDAPACGALETPIALVDHQTFADCLQLLMTKDVMHQVALTDLPRAPEALVCMGLDEVLASALGVEPATCKPTPSPVPTHSPDAGPTPTPAGPTPIPTPSPGEGGCQPRLFGPCQAAPFTGCCQTERHCAFIIGEDGPGYCIADPPSSTESPAPSATPTVQPTVAPTPGGPTASMPTPTPTQVVGPTVTAAPTSTPAPTETPSITGSPGEPTVAPPTPTATVATCDTATVTITTSYEAQSPPDVVAGVTVIIDYPGDLLDLPGTGSQPTVIERITNLSGASGLFNSGDQDFDQDGDDDRVSVGLISTSAAVPSGTFARIVFDCRDGRAAPVAADFDCTPDVSSLLGNLVDATCAVAVTTSR